MDKQTALEDSPLEDLLIKAQEVARSAAQIAREATREVLQGESLDVATKSNRNDLVTRVDKQVENFIAENLCEPTGYAMLGEEGHSVENFNGRVWVVDPIDGTMNFVATHRDFAISIALVEDGVPVLAVVCDVMRDTYYTALRGKGAWKNGEALQQVDAQAGVSDAIIITDLKEMVALPRLQQALIDSRGHRRYGSAALECVEVAASQAGAFVHMWVSPWDIAGAMLIAQEVGAIVTRLDGTPLDVRYKGSIICAWPHVHSELVDRLMTRAS